MLEEHAEVCRKAASSMGGLNARGTE
jgi:hypothetical protein